MKSKVLMTAMLAIALVGCNGESTKVEDAHPKHGKAHANHWDYGTENGPTHWEEFSKTCGKGIHQSPVNIIPGETISMDHSYDLSMHEDVTSINNIIDNGHSINATPHLFKSI